MKVIVLEKKKNNMVKPPTFGEKSHCNFRSYGDRVG
jgi:hypothetical protein